LYADGTLALLDPNDLDSAPTLSLLVEGAKTLLDARHDARFLLGGSRDAQQGTVWLADEAGARPLDPGSWRGQFLPDGRVLTSRLEVGSACGGITHQVFVKIHPATGDGEAREHAGAFVGMAPDGAGVVLERAGIGDCGPTGGRRPAPPSFATLTTDDHEIPIVDPEAAIAVMTGTRVLATLRFEVGGMLGSGACALVIGETRTPLGGASCGGRWVMPSLDGRFIATSERAAEGGRPELRVLDAHDGTVLSVHDGGVDADIIGLDSVVAGCFSPDGETLVVARGDGSLVATTPRGGGPERRTLGTGSCEGFSADGRTLLAATKDEDRRFRLVSVADGQSRDLGPDVIDARFVPPSP
jgi:hypothetical protein